MPICKVAMMLPFPIGPKESDSKLVIIHYYRVILKVGSGDAQGSIIYLLLGSLTGHMNEFNLNLNSNINTLTSNVNFVLCVLLVESSGM